jgi:diguanylate cyclase
MSKDSAWKQKYFASLEDLEVREKQLAETESVMRHSLTRLSLAAAGIDPGLDEQLEKFRKVVRGGADTAQLQRLIEDISHTVKRIDQKQARGTTAASAKKAETSTSAAPDAVQTETASDKAGRSAKVAPPVAVASASASEGLMMVADVLERQGLEATQLNAVRELIRRAKSDQQFEVAAGKLAALVLSSGTAPVTKSESALPVTSMPVAVDVPRVLVQLLENIQVPADLQQRVEQVRTQLEKISDKTAWKESVHLVAGLMAEIGRAVEKEKVDLEAFLRQLTERLRDLDQQLKGAETQRQVSQRSGQDLDGVVEDQVRGIESSVREATSLGELKSGVQARIETIRTHLADHRRAEERRQAELQTQLNQATARLTAMEAETAQLRTNLQQRHEQAMVDVLTGIPSRLAYEDRLAQEYAQWKRYQTPLTLMMADIDRFKLINDSYGHKAGDKALRLIARLLKQALRETDFIARYGGEEFVILLTQTPSAQAADVAEKLRAVVEKAEFNNGDTRIPITLSIGFTAFRANDEPDAVFARADAALYRAKAGGRNQVSGEGV